MAEGKKSFVIYSEWKDLFETLEDEKCAKLIRHIFRYVNDENPELSDPVLIPVWLILQPVLKRDLKKWENQIEQRSQAGKKSAEQRQRPSTTVNENQRPSTVNVNGNVNVNVLNRQTVYESLRRATPKSFSDARIEEEVSKFINYYSGKEVKNIGSACNNWASNMKDEGKKMVM